MILRVVTAPASEPVTLAEAKVHLRIDTSDEDTLVNGYIAAARQMCELESRRAFVTQTWELSLEAWPEADRLVLPRPPLQSVSSITYVDSNGATQTFSSGDYLVDVASEPGRVILGYGKSWPSATLQPGPSIAVRFVVGYGVAGTVPQMYKQAILLMVGHYFENRENVIIAPGLTPTVLPDAVRSLLGIDRGWF